MATQFYLWRKFLSRFGLWKSGKFSAFSKNKVKIRQARIKDIPQILEVEKAAWGERGVATREMFESRIQTFPEGTLVAEINKKIVGVVATERINYDIEKNAPNWYEITDNGFIKNTHQPDGDAIYGVDLSVTPSFQRQKIGTKLLIAIGKLAISHNIRQGILGGRLPDYHKYANKMPVEEYVRTTVKAKGSIHYLDPEVDFYVKAGLKIAKIIHDYFEDPESLNYGVLLVWQNPFYNKWYRKIMARIFRI